MTIAIEALKDAVMADLAAEKWARDVAAEHKVNIELALRLAYHAESTDICTPCVGAGSVQTKEHGLQRCSECCGRGWVGRPST